MDHREQIEVLFDQADEQTDPSISIAILEEAIRLADTYQYKQLSYNGRFKLLRYCVFGGRPDLAIVTFSWCMAYADKNPDLINLENLLWRYKWVITELPEFPTISREQIEALLEDMRKRYERHGSTLHAIHSSRRDIAIVMGDRERAIAAHTQSMHTKRDDLSDCPACAQSTLIWYHDFLGDDVAAVEALTPITKKKMRCTSVPHTSYANVLLPLLRLGDVESAIRYHKAGYKLIRANRSRFVDAKGDHLVFLALTGNHERAAKLFHQHMPEAMCAVSPLSRVNFFLSAQLFIDRLSADDALSLFKVPRKLLFDGENLRTGEAVAAWLDDKILELAAAFDARNGNDSFKNKIKAYRELGRHAVHCPF